MSDFYFEMNPKFWDKEEPKVMGDIIGRPEAIQMLGDISGKTILDAGCGSGYISRILSRQCSHVVACDSGVEMIEMAKKRERQKQLNIKYSVCDIAKMPFADNSFDFAICVSVLLYCEAKTVFAFFKEIKRVLKNNGVLVLSVPHPYLYSLKSPARNKKDNWIKYYSVEQYDEMSGSQKFKQIYYDKDLNIFCSEIWGHPLSLYIDALLESGLRLRFTRELIIQKNHLIHKKWGTKYGYPIFFQIKTSG